MKISGLDEAKRALVGAAISKARRDLGITLREFCLLTGIPAVKWSRVERGIHADNEEPDRLYLQKWGPYFRKFGCPSENNPE